MQGQLERSAALLQESQSLLKQLGDKPTLATTLGNLAETVLRQGDGMRAAGLYKESLALAADVGSKARVARCLAGLAEVALTHGQPARAARLWGAEETLRQTISQPLSHHDSSRPDYESMVAAARSQLEEKAWEAAWSEGLQMTPEVAIEYALSEEEQPASSPKDDTSLLSGRELEILRLVAQGLTDSQVAQRLYVSPRTVGQHLRSIYRKLGVPSRAAAAKAAVERSLI